MSMKFDSIDTGFLIAKPPFGRLILLFVLSVFCLLSGCSNLPSIKMPHPFAAWGKGDSKASLDRVPSEALEGFSLAVKAMQAGQDDVALELFKELRIIYPKLSGLWLNSGIILMKQEKYQKALPMFVEATFVNPENKVAYNQMGYCLRQLGGFEEAKNAYLEAIKLDPNYDLAHYNLGVLFELYFQDFHSAYTHFLSYQNLQKEKDPTVANWLKDLRRRANIPEPVKPEPEPVKPESVEPDSVEPEPVEPESAEPEWSVESVQPVESVQAEESVQAVKPESPPAVDNQQNNESKTLW